MSVSNTVEYGEGYTAFENKKGLHANPHTRSSSQGRRWEAGWRDAQDDYVQPQQEMSESFTSTGNAILDAVIEEARDG